MSTHPISPLIKFENSQKENTTGTLVQITRNTLVMEVYNPHSIVQLSEVLNNLHIRRDKQIVYKGRAVVNSLVNTGLMLIVSVTLIDPWRDLVEILNQDEEIAQEVERFLQDYQKTHTLNPGFQLVVVKIRSFLNELSRWLEQLDLSIDGTGSPDLLKQEQMINKIAPLLSETIGKLFAEFEAHANAIDKSEIETHKAFAQQNLHPLLLRAPIVYRTYDKPLGYAGDYEMMNMIQRSPIEGNTVYMNLINKQFIDFPVAKSVSNRTETLLNYLHQESKRVKDQGEQFSSISIACGPALELQQFISQDPLSEEGRFNLIDFDERALNYATTQVKNAAKEAKRYIQLNHKKESVHVLLKSASKSQTHEHDNSHDFVYCSGLFDYLSDKVCSRLLRLFYRWLKPGGVIYITNMHTSNPDRQMMEYIMEWFLIYRDERQMRAMLSGIGEQRISYDETGVNIGLEIRKIKE